MDRWAITTGRPAPPQPYYCYFNGVKCTADGCKKDSYYVSDISLNGLSLSGTLPTEIGHFSRIKSFSISNNVLAGSIPSEIGMWSSITSLSLDSNSLTGAVPNSITQMTSLVSLNLSSNSFTGSIPDGIGFLTGLTYLSMSDASITGVIPNTIGLFDKMVEFDVSNNKLEGSIPDTICNLTKLKTLDLSKNTLSGPVPPLFRQLNMLTNLRISDNYITKFGPDANANYFFTGYPTRNDDRYCNNCFPIVAVDVYLCFAREGCPYKKSVTPTRAPTIGGTTGESDTCPCHEEHYTSYSLSLHFFLLPPRISSWNFRAP